MKAKAISIIPLISALIVSSPYSQQKTEWKGKVECELFDDIQWKEDY